MWKEDAFIESPQIKKHVSLSNITDGARGRKRHDERNDDEGKYFPRLWNDSTFILEQNTNSE